MAALQTGLRENKLIEIHEEWLMQRGDGWWMVPSPGQTKIKGVPKIIPLNGLACHALTGSMPRIGGRFFSQWKDGNSFKHNWIKTCERQGSMISTSMICVTRSQRGSRSAASTTR
jgi:hypothetical protein